jgi:molybdate transport system regulatory protein
MSYRKAWMTLKASEKRLGFILLDRRVGGVAGGGSHITDEAKVFMNNYNKFREEARKELEMLYGKYFGERE